MTELAPGSHVSTFDIRDRIGDRQTVPDTREIVLASGADDSVAVGNEGTVSDSSTGSTVADNEP